MDEQTKKNQYGDSSEPIRDFPDVLPVKRMDEVIKTNEPLTDLNSASSPIYKDIQSTNYSPGSKGWRLRANGDSELNQNADASTETTIAGRMTNSAGQNISTSTDTQLTFDTADVEEGITCDLSNDRFEILTAGIYLITAQVSYTDPVSGKIIQAIIEDDSGSYLAQSQWVTSSTDMLSVSVSYMASFSVGDKIQLHTFHNCGGSETIQSGLNTYFNIFKI